MNTLYIDVLHTHTHTHTHAYVLYREVILQYSCFATLSQLEVQDLPKEASTQRHHLVLGGLPTPVKMCMCGSNQTVTKTIFTHFGE